MSASLGGRLVKKLFSITVTRFFCFSVLVGTFESTGGGFRAASTGSLLGSWIGRDSDLDVICSLDGALGN